MKTIKSIKSAIAVLASLAIATSTFTIPTSAGALYDEGSDIPVIECSEIAEFLDSNSSDAYCNFYINTSGIMENPNTIITSDGNMFMLSDYGYHSKSNRVWVVFNDSNTYDCIDDEIIEIFEAPTNDSEELFIYETIIEHIQTML